MITPPLKIGKHEWRIVVKDRTVRYEWRVKGPFGDGVWRQECEWPRARPAGLKRLYALHVHEIMEALS